ncbi:MAG: peptidase domain-containing ABC transporter [Bacilli bacterium]
MKKSLIVLQGGNKDCGAASLLSVIRYFGGDISLDRLIEMTKTTKEGTNFYNLSEASSQIGLTAKCYKVDDINKLKEVNIPYIVQLNNKNYTHFVVVYKFYENKVLIMDPASGKRIVDMFDFTNMWTGYLMIFEKVRPIVVMHEENKLKNVIISTLINNKGTIVFLITLSIIITILSAIVSFYSQIIFDKIINTEINNLIVITLFFSILYIFKNISSYIRNYLIVYLNQKLDIGVILSTFSNIILLPYSFYHGKTTGEILSRISDLSHVKTFISKVIITIFLDIIIFISSFIIIYFIKKEMLLVIICLLIIYILIILIFNPILRKINIKNQNNNEKINNQIIEDVSSFETIKNLNAQNNIILKFENDYNKLLFTSYYGEKINNILLFIKELVNDLGVLVINFVAFYFIMKDNLTIGKYMTISFLFSYLLFPIGNFITLLNEHHYIKNSIKRVNNLLDADQEIIDDSKLEVNGNIEIKNLSFSFNNRNYFLNNISFSIKDKEKVLILGESGIGKSTLLKLIYKYYDIDRDVIFINGYDINDYSLSDIRRNITYISQNEMLYTSSIRDNIILGRNISEEDFLNMCKITYVDEIIKDNILGYDYVLEENGINISGGQRQRIILARGLLKNSKIIMIDEGLSQIDINLERIILENLFCMFYDKTFIIVSHRENNIDLYDKVIRLSDSKVRSK